jgi:hypothetical protein
MSRIIPILPPITSWSRVNFSLTTPVCLMVVVKYSCLRPQPPTACFNKMCALGVIVAF